MAKFTAGPTIGQISGSIGGTTFGHNRYGQYARRRAVPVKVTSIAAYTIKAFFSGASSAWQSLSAANKLAWNTWATTNPVIDALGMPQALTGHAAFVGNRARMLYAGETPLTTPPVDPAPNPLTSLVLTADIGAGGVELAFAETPLGANDHIWFDCIACSSAGIAYIKSYLRFGAVSAAAQATAYNIKALVEAAVGTLQVGQTLHVQAAVFSDATGLISQPLRDSAVIVTT